MSARPVIRQLAQLDDFATLSDAAAGTASLRTLGAGATQALNKATADGLYATSASVTAAAAAAPILAPATSSRNTVQPTVDIAGLTLKQLPTGGSPAGTNSKAPLIRLVAYGHPDLNGTASNKLLTIENPNYGFWDPAQPQFYICTTGNLASNRDILLSGTVTGTGDGYVIARPSTDAAMMWLWSDVNVGLQVRASTVGGEVVPPSFVANNYLFSGLSPNGNYVFAVEQNGLLRWGASGPASTTTRAQMDTYFGRVPFTTVSALATNNNLWMTVNQKGIYGTKADGTTSLRLLQIDSANQIGIGQASGGIPMHFWATTYRFVDDANTIYRVEINSAGITLATGHNIVLATSGAGTKIGTGATQLLGFWGKAPVVQPAAYTQTYATATRTHANPTAVALTDNTTGTANTTLAAVVGAVYATDGPSIRDNFADLAASNNAIIVDLANVKQVLSSLIDDKQAIGTCAP